jgi:hypothetical protein
VTQQTKFLLYVHNNFLPIQLPVLSLMITGTLYYTASGERTYCPDKVNIQQRIPSGWTVLVLLMTFQLIVTSHFSLTSLSI